MMPDIFHWHPLHVHRLHIYNRAHVITHTRQNNKGIDFIVSGAAMAIDRLLNHPNPALGNVYRYLPESFITCAESS